MPRSDRDPVGVRIIKEGKPDSFKLTNFAKLYHKLLCQATSCTIFEGTVTEPPFMVDAAEAWQSEADRFLVLMQDKFPGLNTREWEIVLKAMKRP